ncbi:hypothetical protein FB446DRAFT_200645 [Lentinula raphanica]|nr:hypothetical protein FB446DRAFT_200645 [Lentinula raphanica]
MHDRLAERSSNKPTDKSFLSQPPTVSPMVSLVTTRLDHLSQHRYIHLYSIHCRSQAQVPFQIPNWHSHNSFKTEFKICKDIPTKDCGDCRASGSVSKIEARTRKNILIAKIGIASEYFWRCQACGWTSNPSFAHAHVHGSQSTSTANATNTPKTFASRALQPKTSQGTAEMWHRPPSFVRDLPAKMPALRPGSPESQGQRRQDDEIVSEI